MGKKVFWQRSQTGMFKWTRTAFIAGTKTTMEWRYSKLSFISKAQYCMTKHFLSTLVTWQRVFTVCSLQFVPCSLVVAGCGLIDDRGVSCDRVAFVRSCDGDDASSGSAVSQRDVTLHISWHPPAVRLCRLHPFCLCDVHVRYRCVSVIVVLCRKQKGTLTLVIGFWRPLVIYLTIPFQLHRLICVVLSVKRQSIQCDLKGSDLLFQGIHVYPCCMAWERQLAIRLTFTTFATIQFWIFTFPFSN